MRTKEEKNTYARNWRRLNQEKTREYARKWKTNNKDKVSAESRRWRNKYPDKAKANRDKWRKNNILRIKEYDRQRRIILGNSLSYRYSKYKQSAKTRGYEFSLTVDEFKLLLADKCHYCGTGGKVGVDRIDNSIGYVFKNCVPCCWECNKFKGGINKEKFESMVHKIAKHLSRE